MCEVFGKKTMRIGTTSTIHRQKERMCIEIQDIYLLRSLRALYIYYISFIIGDKKRTHYVDKVKYTKKHISFL